MNKVSNKNNFCELRTTPWVMLNKDVEGNSVWSQSVTKKKPQKQTKHKTSTVVFEK